MPDNPVISQIKISEGSTDVTYDVKDTKARSTAIQFATCSTAAATGTKVVECSDFALANEAKILVKFDNTNSAAVSNLKLNVNGTGAKAVRYRGANLPQPGLIKAGGLYLFVYTDNLYWNIIGDLDTAGDGMFATCSTSADVATKEVTIDNFNNTEGAVIFVKFTNTNTATGTLYLKVNGSSSRMKYRSSDLATSGIIIANSIHAFVKTSSYWYLVGELYQHPSYTARTGKPTENLTPSFGDTVTISQITSDATGHVTAATDRTIKIPNDTYSYNSSGYGAKGLVPAPASSDSGKYLQAGSGWASLPTAGLNTAGIVKLSSSTSDTSTTAAATASAVKSAYDLANSKSSVSFTQTLTSGTKIGSISINGSSTDIYCSTDTDTQVHVKKATTTKAYLMGTSTLPETSNKQTTALADTGVYLTTTAGELQATNFVGKINGFDIGMSVPSGSALTDTWTPMTGATSSANGTVGYVNAVPPSNGYNTKYLRADGTWAVPPGTVDSKVSQTTTTDDAFYKILLGNSDSDTTETAGARKASDLAYNANNGLLTVGDGIYYNELQTDGTTYLKRPLIRHGTENFYIGGTGKLRGSSSDHNDHLGRTYIFTGYDAESGTYNKNIYMCIYNGDGTDFTITPLWHTLMMRADFTSNTDDWSSAGLRLDDFASDLQFKIIRHMKASGASSYTDVPAWFAAKGGVGLGVKRDGHAGIISFDTNQTWSGTNNTVPTVSFAGGIVDDTNNNYKKPSWYFKLTGTNGSTYNLDNFSTTDVKVAQNNTTANAAYRVLLSYSSNDTNETNTARKSSGLTYNPSTGVLGVNGYTVSGTSNSSYNFDDFSTIKRFSTSSNGQDNGWSTIVTADGIAKLQDSATSSLYVTRHIPVSGSTVYDPPVWYAARHSVGLMFANQNQVAIMSMASNNSVPLIKFGATGGGPNGTPVADGTGPANPGNGVGWYFGLTGTSATTYNLDSFSTTDTKVTQTITDGSYNYRILMSYTNSDTTATEGARKASGFYYNPGLGVMTVPTLKLTHTNTDQILNSLNIRIEPSVIFDYGKLLQFYDYDNKSTGINLVPFSDGISSIGYSEIHWASSYINTMNGELNGSISSSTTATTQSDGDNSTKVATTAYVENSIPYYLVRTTENNTSANDWETVLGSSNFDKNKSNYLTLFRHGATSGTPQSWFAGQQCLGLFMRRTNMAAMISLNTNLAPSTLNYPRVTFAASKHAGTSGDGPTATDGWYFSLKGKTASEYDLDDLSLTASSLNNSSTYSLYGLPLMSITPSTNDTAFKIKMSDGFRYSQAPGTTTSEGTAILVLGNNTATSTAGNKTGGVRFYGSGTKYINLKAGAMAEDLTTWIPKVRIADSTLTATKVVYESSSVTSSVTLNSGSNAISTSKAPTYFKVYMRKFRTTSGNQYTLAYYDSVDVPAVSNRATTFVLCDSYDGTSPAHATFTGYIKVTASSSYFKLDLYYSGKKYTLSGTSVTEANVLANEQAFGIYKIVAVYETHD